MISRFSIAPIKGLLDLDHLASIGGELALRISAESLSEAAREVSSDQAEVVFAPISNANVGPFLERFRRTRYFAKHREKIVVYSLDPNRFPALRGFYPGASRLCFDEDWARPVHYISTHLHRFYFSKEECRSKDILMSFVGSSRTHRLREDLLGELEGHPDAFCLDSGSRSQAYWWERADARTLREKYRETMIRSRCVLCPRGISPASIRVFEAMEASAVPIIISDALELPVGPNWESFSLRVREKNLAAIPDIVASHEAQLDEMGLEARRIWERYFAPERALEYLLTQAPALLSRDWRNRRLERISFTSRQHILARLKFALKALRK